MQQQLTVEEELQSTRVCDECGQRFITGYGYSLGMCWLVTGHAAIGAFMCQEALGNQHWGCSPEHALAAALACAREHMLPQLQQKYTDAQEAGISRISEAHKELLDEKDEQFHFISRK